MKPTINLISITGAIFLIYGLGFVFIPETLALLIIDTAPPSNSSAMIDMRATYGGLSIGVGVTLLTLASNTEYHRVGTLAVFALMLGMAVSRGYGMLMDDHANIPMWIYLAIEIIVAAWAALRLRRS